MYYLSSSLLVFFYKFSMAKFAKSNNLRKKIKQRSLKNVHKTIYSFITLYQLTKL